MSQELMTVDSGLPALRKPEEIVDEAKARANVLMQIVKEKNLSKMLGNKEHIQIEAWQTVGRFFNCTGGSDEAEPVEIDGVKGAKAHAKVIDERTGQLVSEAIGYCMRDESNWRNKPWFQVASMAQTRAMSKALANKFRWVAVLAGYSGTPAEEMTGDEGKTFEQKFPQAESSPKQMAPASSWIVPFGKMKGQPISDVSNDDVDYLIRYYHGKLNDQANANSRYRGEWEEAVLAIEGEKAQRLIAAGA